MQRRIVLSVVFSILLILISLGIISYRQVQDSIRRSSANQLALAEMMRNSLEQVLESGLARLYDIPLFERVDLTDRDTAPEHAALRAAYQYALFSDGLFLLDARGRRVASYPSAGTGAESFLDNELVTRVMRERRPVMSDVIFSTERSGRALVFVLVPLTSIHGGFVGIAGGVMSPTNTLFTQVMQSLPAESDTVVELTDSQGTVLASNSPGRVLRGTDHSRFLSGLIAERKSSVTTCHRCHENGSREKTRDILAFAPLSLAPWGVAVRVPEDTVFASSAALGRGFLAIGLVSLGAAFLLTLGMTKSIVQPVRQLIRATERVARGDLSEPVNIPGGDEIGSLARSFDGMRMKLAESLATVQEYTVGLEQRVYERTILLEEKQIKNKMLLKKVITSLEDERKRIARELHDDTLQSLAAVLMNIEMCRLHPEHIRPEKIESVKEIVIGVISGMNRLVQNLRPMVLDDLGFEAAVVWLLDRNLRDKGIACHLSINELCEERLSPEQEITLFRIIQEASFNIARHSRAQNAFIVLRTDENEFSMDMDDDGEGFDTASVFKETLTGRGLGILGMKERAALLNGALTVCSAPGFGTQVSCRMPLASED